MLVDIERAWLELRAYIASKSGHGSFGPQGLLAHMAQLELECRVDEGPTERIIRLFGVQLSEDLIHAVEQATADEPKGPEASQTLHTASKGASNGNTRQHHH